MLARTVTARRCRSPQPGVVGFTLIEMLIALAIGSLLLLTMTPDWGARRAGAELRNHAEMLLQAINVARGEAIKRGTRVELCPSSDALRCDATAGWESGFITYVHDNGATPASMATILTSSRAAPSGIAVQGNRPLTDYVSFTSLGHARRHDGALQMGTFTVCRSGHDALKVVLANSGRVRLDVTRERCS